MTVAAIRRRALVRSQSLGRFGDAIGTR